MKIKVVVISVLIIATYKYLMEPVNWLYVSEDIKNYDLGEGVVFVELNYQGSVGINIDDDWGRVKFDNELPVTAWQHYRLTDNVAENFTNISINMLDIDTSDKMMVISLGRKLESLYYYKQSGYLDLYSNVRYIGEPVFSKEYYENTMFIYTSPEYINFPYIEDIDDNFRFNKNGDIPYEVRPYTKRSADDESILMRPERRLDLILKKLKN